MTATANVVTTTQPEIEAPAFLSQEWLGYFEKDTASLPGETKQMLMLHLRMAYSKGRTDGFKAGLDKGADIYQGSPKVKEWERKTKMTEEHHDAAMGCSPVEMGRPFPHDVDDELSRSMVTTDPGDDDFTAAMKSPVDLMATVNVMLAFSGLLILA